MRTVSIGQVLDEVRRRLDRLEPEAAWAAAAAGAIIVDTRCADQRRADGVVPGSIHAPLSVLPWRVDPDSGHSDPRLADLGARLILLCAHGYSSSLAAASLKDLGFDGATDVVGGFEAWLAAGLPVEPAPVSEAPSSPAS